jgi:hypothetical protein
MSISNIVNEFQNYSYNSTTRISIFLNELKQAGNLNEDNINIREYILPEVIILLNKAILNRLSTDLLFQKNYWSWGFVTLYYSNFFLAQALNRLKGDFFVFIPSYGRKGRKAIKLEDENYQLLDIENRYRDSHKGELQKLRENYDFLLDLSNQNFLNAILDIDESSIRNKINYQLNHYKEIAMSNVTDSLSIEKCLEEHKNSIQSRSSIYDEFKLLYINRDRFNLLFDLLNGIKDINEVFEIEYQNFKTNFSNLNLEQVSQIVKKQFDGVLHEL